MARDIDVFNAIGRAVGNVERQVRDLQSARDFAIPEYNLDDSPPEEPVENQSAINRADDKPYYFRNGEWHPYGEAGGATYNKERITANSLTDITGTHGMGDLKAGYVDWDGPFYWTGDPPLVDVDTADNTFVYAEANGSPGQIWHLELSAEGVYNNNSVNTDPQHWTCDFEGWRGNVVGGTASDWDQVGFWFSNTPYYSTFEIPLAYNSTFVEGTRFLSCYVETPVAGSYTHVGFRVRIGQEMFGNDDFDPTAVYQLVITKVQEPRYP